jgi:peptidoglycan hydrolase-like protein with peptidoglycan-binding domain
VVDARKPVKRQPVVDPVVDVPDPVEPAPVKVAPEPVVEPPAVVLEKVANKRSATILELQRTMSQGDHGPRVEVVQKALANAGFFEGKQDGRYGTLLGRAVRQFQGSKGLRITGEVNPQTWEALFS